MAVLVLVDDHVLLRKGLSSLVEDLGHSVIFEADNGLDFMKKIDVTSLPEVVLMDINMPGKDGFETTQWLKTNHPSVRVLALSMLDSENSIIRMLKSGARGYILKDCEPAELQAAIDDVINKGYYYSELVTGKLINAINNMGEDGELTVVKLSDHERSFLKLICSDFSYKEVADQMFVSPRTIDGYRDALFGKLNVKTRVGLVLYAVKNGVIELS